MAKIILNDVALHGVKNAKPVTTSPSPEYIKLQKESNARIIKEQCEYGRILIKARNYIAKTSR